MAGASPETQATQLALPALIVRQDFLSAGPARRTRQEEHVSSRAKENSNFDDAIEHIGFGPFQWKLVFLCGFVWMADSMELMILTFVLPHVREEWHLSRFATSTIGALTFAGMLGGSYFWGLFSDRFGRRVSMLASVSCTLLFGLMSAVSTGPISLTILRMLVGFGVGGASIAFSLLAEYMPSANRGAWLTIVQGAFWTFGVINESWIAWVVLPNHGWRLLLVISALPLTLLLALHWFLLPESARWLAVRGNVVQAQFFLREVAVTNGHPLGGEFELRVIQRAKDAELSSLFTEKLYSLTLSVWALWACNVFVYYGCVMFTDTLFRKQSDWSVYAVALITSIAEIPGLLVAVLLIDSKGRKSTQAALFTFCAASLCFLTGMARFPTGLLLFFMFCARGAISGAFVSTYVYTAEVYPTACRTTGLGAASAMGRVCLLYTSPSPRDS
eukprot:TRINITY_DN15154_c0_g1_i3.p1 TRINITY_DN15154_c0_g1~~TRINITY_DN15154_c0_g1_i3.p1  ORF type:complete len:445 (-),score=92.70 TRINITY_DN15154_c0_g1_i3:85-1419(-)